MYYLYRHINKITQEPFYIGISNIYKRGDGYQRSRTAFSRSEEWKEVVKNCGYDVEIILHEEKIEKIYQKEKEFIALYNRYSLVNKTKGGGGALGHTVSEKTKRRLSIVNTGKNHPQYGTKASDKTRLKQSVAKLGCKSKTAKKVYCITNNTIYESRGEAANILFGDRLKSNKVQDIIKKRRRSYLGYRFIDFPHVEIINF